MSVLAWAAVIGGCIGYALLMFWALMYLEHRSEQRRVTPPTKPMPLGDRCGFCHDLSTVGDIAKCACPRPCGAKWCGALRRAGRGQA